MFQLVTLAGGTPVPVLAADGKPFVFPTGAEAAQAAKELSAERGEKVQPRPMADDGSWKRREAQRFIDGTYQHVPFNDAPWFLGSEAWRDHFLHVSTERPDMVAFTESPEKGIADRQTRLKLGVYLTRYFADVLTSDEIRDIATDFTAEREENTVLFAKTADEIEQVYLTGPHSCMAHKASYYGSPFHPVRVYAAGDLQVAYLERDGDITARALVWPAKKRFSRIYGDEARLYRLLEGMGYVQDGLDGARLTRVMFKDRFVVPYIDGDHHLVRDAGDFLVIDEDGDVDCEVTCGLSEEYLDATCGRCEERTRSDDLVLVHFTDWRGRRQSDAWCSCCTDETFICDATGERWSDNDAIPMSNGDTWSQAHFEDHGFSCPDCGGNFPVEDGTLGEDGEMRCSDCHDEWQERNRKDDEEEEAEEADDAPPPALPFGHAVPTLPTTSSSS